MANLYSNGVDQAIDSNGDVYPSAQRYFYDNNTTNLRTIWQDKAKTSAHANPVVANAAGVFPDIFIEGSYSTRLETSAGALIDTQDDVNVFETDLLASQSTTGAALTNLDYDEASSSGLSFAYSSGRVDDEDGTITEISSGALTLPSTQTSYIYLDYRSHTVVQQTTTGRPVSSLLYTVVTDGGAITSVTSNKDAFRDPQRLPTDYIDGLILSLDADTDHDINVLSGRCRDSTDTLDLNLTAEITKQLDANWAAGDDAGGLPSTVTLVDAMTIYVFAIGKTDGSMDVGFDETTAATKLLAASTFTHYRLIGQFTINASLNIASGSLEEVLSSQIQALATGASSRKVDGKATGLVRGGDQAVACYSASSGPGTTEQVNVMCLRSGTYKVRHVINRTSGTNNGQSQIYKDGAPFGVLQVGVSEDITEEVDFVAGERLQVYTGHQVGTTCDVTVWLGVEEPLGPHFGFDLTGLPTDNTDFNIYQG
ncbi:hypothetical protein [uncultured Paraglaciecola sp.]|uniref:hypothetical protein n=1 Tax=uncultured Paraglaciecola sp. TaxID=1765024 RepID=UPI00263308F0|nr:hypothetical protein [uncultured Paraglaciecola sp.]